MGDTLTVQSTSEITDFDSCRFVEGDQRGTNFDHSMMPLQLNAVQEIHRTRAQH